MSLPNFMCIGAAKSGTTTLYDILKQHPEIFIPAFKEPHFFDIPENYNNGIELYERNYFRKADNRIIADFTPSYFFEKEAPKRIFKDIGSICKATSTSPFAIINSAVAFSGILENTNCSAPGPTPSCPPQ